MSDKPKTPEPAPSKPPPPKGPPQPKYIPEDFQKRYDDNKTPGEEPLRKG